MRPLGLAPPCIIMGSISGGRVLARGRRAVRTGVLLYLMRLMC